MKSPTNANICQEQLLFVYIQFTHTKLTLFIFSPIFTGSSRKSEFWYTSLVGCFCYGLNAKNILLKLLFQSAYNVRVVFLRNHFWQPNLEMHKNQAAKQEWRKFVGLHLQHMAM